MFFLPSICLLLVAPIDEDMNGGDDYQVCGDERMPAHFRQNSITEKPFADDATSSVSTTTSISESRVILTGDDSFILVSF